MGSPADNRKAEPGTHPWVAQVRNATYKRIATGTWFLCAGAILLLNTLDRLSWGVWIDLLRLWPLLLISLGIRWIFVRTPLHPLVLLGPLLVVAAAAYVVWGALSNDWSAPIREGAREADGTVGVSCHAGSSAGRLDIRFDAGRLHLVSRGEEGTKGIAGSIRYAGDEPVRVCSGSSLRLGQESAASRVRVLSPFHLGANRWEAALSAAHPLAIDAWLAGAAADIDLTGFRLTDVALSASASDVALRLGAPTGRVAIDITGALSSVRVVVPEGTCYTLTRRRRSNILRIDGERAGRARQITAPACAGKPDLPRYAIDLDLPLASVRVDTGS